MLSVITQSIVLAAGGSLSVGSTSLVMLLLMSDRGWRSGLSYVLGYTGAYTLIGMVVILAGNEVVNEAGSQTRSLLPVIYILISLALLSIALWTWRKPSNRSDGGVGSRLVSIVDGAPLHRIFAVGALVTVVNFKNLAIYLSAVSVIQASNLILTAKMASVLPVTFVFCLSGIVPLFISIGFPRHAIAVLSWIKRNLDRHSRAIGIWVPFAFGLIFLIRSIRGLL